MENEKSPQSLLLVRYDLEDLFQVYIQLFFSRFMFGPKAHDHPLIESNEDFIVRARYLLSIIPNEHLEALFQAASPQYNTSYWIPNQHASPLATASWIAGILKQKHLISYIGELVKQGGSHYYSHAWFGSLLLFDDPSLDHHYIHYLDSQTQCPDINYRNPSMAIYCLKLWDKKYGTNHQTYINDFVAKNPYHKRATYRINRLLSTSVIFRAGITFTKSFTLQKKLKTLLHETIPLHQYTYGLFQPPLIRQLYASEKPDESRYHHYKEQYKAFGAVTPSLQPIHKPLNNQLFRTSHQFENAVRHYVQNPRRKAYLPEIKKEALLAHDEIDILAGLEIDINYQLPAAIVDICYQKLIRILPKSYALYEAYALSLLMRGSGFDKKAKVLHNKAQQIKAKYKWVVSKNDLWWGDYVMLKGTVPLTNL